MEYTFKNLDDLDEVSDGIVSCYNEFTLQLKGIRHDVSKSALEEVKRRKDSELLLLIYTEAGEIAGMAHVSYHCVPIKPVGYVSAVVIDEKYRGHGLGLILVEEIERRAKERWSDIKAFNLTSKPSRGTQGFYLRLGYRMRTKEAGDETIFYVKDVDGYAHS